MPKIFIDTNVFLDFYESSEESLKILLELQQHSKYIIFPSLVYDEFLRQRVGVLQKVIKGLITESKFTTFNSALIQNLDEFSDLNDARNKHKEKIGIIKNKINEMMDNTEKDLVFGEVTKLYKSKDVNIFEHDRDIIQKAKQRQLLGQPPGTDKNICDEVIWETILSNADDDIVIVSRNSTYKDNHFYLTNEFKDKNSKELIKITDKITEGIKSLGEEVPPEIVELEEKQIEDIKSEVIERVETVLGILTPLEQKVLRMRHGLYDSGNEESYKNFLRAIFYKPEHDIEEGE